MSQASREEKAIRLIFQALRKAEEKFPGWPDDPVHGAAIVAEESGELTQAALDFFYGRTETPEKMKEEAAQVAAMGLRLLVSLVEER